MPKARMDLGDYRILAAALFGEDSKAVTFLDKKISESRDGVRAKVIAHETQMLYLLTELHRRDEVKKEVQDEPSNDSS